MNSFDYAIRVLCYVRIPTRWRSSSTVQLKGIAKICQFCEMDLIITCYNFKIKILLKYHTCFRNTCIPCSSRNLKA